MTVDNKIYVIGPAGSGKTTFARGMARRRNIPYFSIDDIKWINDQKFKHYTHSRSYQERTDAISEIIASNNSWIFDGVYCADWVNPVFQHADEIIFLDTPLFICQWRCIKRFIKTYNSQTSSFKALLDLLKWNQSYKSKYLTQIRQKVDLFNKKYYVVSCTKGNIYGL